MNMIQEFLNQTNQRHRRIMWGLSLIVLVIVFGNWMNATLKEDFVALSESSRADESLPLFSQSSVQSGTEDSATSSPLAHQTDQSFRIEDGQGIDRYLPEYMQGTEVDGSLSMDEQGDLIVDLDTKRVFDYFLSMQGRVSDDQLLVLMDLYLRQRLSGAAIDQARSLFDEYLSYKQALMEFQPPENQQLLSLSGLETPTADAIRARLHSINLLRRQYLNPVAADAFFGEQERYDNDQLERLDQDASDQVGRDQRLMSEIISAAENDDSIYTLRQQRYGNDYAKRMRESDFRNRQWQQRLSSYHQQRQEILEQDGLSDFDRQSMISNLRKTEFSESEQSRIMASEVLMSGQ